MNYALSLGGTLIFGVGGFMLISAWDSGKPSLITRLGACALLVIGAGLFLIGVLAF
jgi:hypothetical protein